MSFFQTKVKNCKETKSMNNYIPDKRKKDPIKGFTLIELIMTIVLVGIVSIAAAVFLSDYLQGTASLRKEIPATSLARMEMERVSNLNFADIELQKYEKYENYPYELVRGVEYLKGTDEKVKQITVDVYTLGGVDLLCSVVMLRAEGVYEEEEDSMISTQAAIKIQAKDAMLNMDYDFGKGKDGYVRFCFRPRSEPVYNYTKWVQRKESGSYYETVESLATGTTYVFYAQIMYKGPAEPIIVDGNKKTFTTLEK